MVEQVEWIKQMLTDFSKDECVATRLAFLGRFKEHSRAGKELARWENWLQIELLYWMGKPQQQPIRDLWFEDRYTYDKRYTLPDSKKGKSTASIDLTYRADRTFKDYYNGIELKVKTYSDYSIRGIISDLERVSCIKRSEWVFRSMTGVAIFMDDEEIEKKKYVKMLREKFGETSIIPFGEHWKAAVVGWEASTLSEARQDVYEKWVKDALS